MNRTGANIYRLRVMIVLYVLLGLFLGALLQFFILGAGFSGSILMMAGFVVVGCVMNYLFTWAMNQRWPRGARFWGLIILIPSFLFIIPTWATNDYIKNMVTYTVLWAILYGASLPANRSQNGTAHKTLLVVLKAIGASVLVAVVSFVLYLYLNDDDVSRVDDSVLAPSSQILSPAENAHSDLMRAAENLRLSDDEASLVTDMVDRTTWDARTAAAVVDRNAVALDAFTAATWKRGYQDPIVQGDMRSLNADTVLSDVAPVRKLAQLNVLRSRLLFQEGKQKEALDTLLNNLYLAHALETSPRGGLVQYLVGLAMKRASAKNFQVIVSESRLPAEVLKGYAKTMGKFRNSAPGLQEVLRMEYAMISNSKEQFFDDPLVRNVAESRDGNTPVVGYYYKPNQTQRLFVELFQDYVDDAAKECRDIDLPEAQTSDKRWALLFTENAAGQMMVDAAMSAYKTLFEKRCQEEMMMITTQMELAALAYQAAWGHYPAELTELVPEYLDSIDREYDGKPIVYNPLTGRVSQAGSPE